MQTKQLTRILIKLTGESLGQKSRQGIDFEKTTRTAKRLIEIQEATLVQMAIVIGGGNLVRGRDASQQIDRATADHIGMLGTIMNGLALEEAINRIKGEGNAILLTSLSVNGIAEGFFRKKAVDYLNQQKIVILAGGIGNPFFSTDSAAALRAAELKCQIVLKASNVDGVFDSNPTINKNAQMFSSITFQESLKRGITVMDTAAFALCRDAGIPIIVFNSNSLNNITKIVRGEKVGTLIY